MPLFPGHYGCSYFKNVYATNVLLVLFFQSLNCVRLFCNPMDCSPQAPLSVEFPRQDYYSGFPLQTNLLDPGMEPISPASAGRFFTTEPPGKDIQLVAN